MNDKVLTSFGGTPIADNQNSETAGPRGPVLLQDFYLQEKLATFNRERTPERVVHAKGAGAFGTFKVTHDITKYTKAKIFEKVGKKSDCVLRFSTVGGEKGSGDSVRDPRGFAVKFYTEEGNWDVVGNNTPVFFLRDPMKFPDFIHTQKRHPASNLPCANMMWDYWSLSPEALHQITILFSDRGTPDGYRHMNGYGSHTFSMLNKDNQRVWVKFHFKTKQGIKNLSAEQATITAGENPNYATEDLWRAIQKKDFPKWTLYIQVMTEEQAKTHKDNPFDLTKVWSHKEYPLIEVGELELNRNPANYHTDIELSAFSPSNVVPGISYSPDKVLQARIYAYPDAHRYRIGGNFNLLPVNTSKHAACPYHRDGMMRFDDNAASQPNYEPNSLNGPAQAPQYKEPPLPISGDAEKYDHREGNDDFTQAGDLFRMLPEQEQQNLINNIVASMKDVKEETLKRQIEHFKKADPDYGSGIAVALGLE